MDHFKGFTSSLKGISKPILQIPLFRRHIKQRPVALQLSIIGRLPLELLLQILSFLPVESAASFSLSCKHFKNLIGIQYVEMINGSKADTSKFLALLERDLPDQISCSSCGRLHKIENASRYSLVTQRPHHAPLPDCRQRNIKYNIDPSFSTVIYQMVMKSHAQQKSRLTTKLLRLLSVNYTLNTGSTYESYIKTRHTEYRIANNSLHMRKETMIFLHSGVSFNVVALSHFPICIHIIYTVKTDSANRPARLKGRRVGQFADPVVIYTKDISCLDKKRTSTGIQQCFHCRTEYRIDLRRFDDTGTIILCTTWRDLGTGAKDEVWKRQIESRDSRDYPLVWFNIGDVYSAFQQGEHFDVDEILLQRAKWGEKFLNGGNNQHSRS